MRLAAPKSEESKEDKTESNLVSIPADYDCQSITSEVLFDPLMAMDSFVEVHTPALSPCRIFSIDFKP